MLRYSNCGWDHCGRSAWIYNKALIKNHNLNTLRNHWPSFEYCAMKSAMIWIPFYATIWIPCIFSTNIWILFYWINQCFPNCPTEIWLPRIEYRRYIDWHLMPTSSTIWIRSGSFGRNLNLVINHKLNTNENARLIFRRGEGYAMIWIHSTFADNDNFPDFRIVTELIHINHNLNTIHIHRPSFEYPVSPWPIFEYCQTAQQIYECWHQAWFE